MREILFRGKNKYGKWHYGYYTEGYYIDGTAVSWIEVVDRKKKDTECPTVIPDTVGQFTGLTDKNGKRIFEGDIVEHHVQGDILVNRGVVNWDKENARWAYRLNTMNPCFAFYNPKAFEVIGNIHDNPELLGGVGDG